MKLSNVLYSAGTKQKLHNTTTNLVVASRLSPGAMESNPNKFPTKGKLVRRGPGGVHSFFFHKNVVFPAQAEYSYFSSDFRLKIFLYYS